MSFRARYKSPCRDCDEGIQPNELIELDDDRTPYHVVCPEDQRMDGKPAPVCPRCFMVIPVSGICGTCEPES